MDWRDQGILLSVRPHGETSAIIDVLTRSHGRHAGVVRGGVSRRMTPILQPGAELDVTWRARLEAHIGSFTVEPLSTSAALAMEDRLMLAGLNAVTSLLRFSLPEREAHPALYEKSRALLDMLDRPEHWPLAYLHWELALLEELGFGLDLRECAVLGRGANDLSYVSPKSGRAVSRKGAGEWADRLLPLPRCLIEIGAADAEELAQGFAITGHFLAHHMAPEIAGKPLPDARQRFVGLVARRG